MKTILLLLLIPIMMQGQIDTTKSYDWTNKRTPTAEKIKAKFKQINDAKIERLKECEEANTTYATYVRIDTMTARYTWIESFVNMWDEYAKECYADSTEYKSPFWAFQDGRLVKPPSTWTHKEPTIDGFIEHLRNKLKGE